MASAVVGTVACLVAECAEGGPAGLAGPAADLCMRFLDKRPRAQPTGAAEVAACGMRSTDRRPLRAGPQLLRLLRSTGAVGDCVRLGRSGPATAVWIALALQGVRAQPSTTKGAGQSLWLRSRLDQHSGRRSGRALVADTLARTPRCSPSRTPAGSSPRSRLHAERPRLALAPTAQASGSAGRPSKASPGHMAEPSLWPLPRRSAPDHGATTRRATVHRQLAIRGSRRPGVGTVLPQYTY